MTQFSEKLRGYTERRGISVMSLAKQLGIDRATLHKIINGERRPTSDEAVTALCRQLLLSVDETNELMELYRISVMGENVYRRRQGVKRMIEKLAALETEVVPVTERRGLADAPQLKICSSNAELTEYIIPLIAESAANGSGVRIIAQPATALKLLQPAMVCGNTVVEHIICFDNSSSAEASGYNLEKFPDICEFVIAYPNYRPLCYYDNVVSHINSMTLLPVLIITDDFVICADYELCSGVVYKDPAAVAFYRRQYEFQKHSCYPFICVDNSFERMLSRTQTYPRYTMTIDSQPSIVLALDENQITSLKTLEDEYFNTIIKYSEMLKKQFLGKGYINIFSREGLEDFMETGLSAEFITVPKLIFSPEDRIKILKKMIYLAENGRYEYRIARKDYTPDGIRASLLDGNSVKLVSYGKGKEKSFVDLTENSIVYAFNDYFSYLISEGKVMSCEKTVGIMRELLDSYVK